LPAVTGEQQHKRLFCPNRLVMLGDQWFAVFVRLSIYSGSDCSIVTTAFHQFGDTVSAEVNHAALDI